MSETDQPEGRTPERDELLRQALVDLFDPPVCSYCGRPARWRDRDGDFACEPSSGCAAALPGRKGLSFRGETLPLAEWALRYKLNPCTLRWRLLVMGVSAEAALTTPVRRTGWNCRRRAA